MDELTIERRDGISRRTVIKRGAIVGGALWAAPAITTLSRAGAQANEGTPLCECQPFTVEKKITRRGNTTTVRERCEFTEESCACNCYCEFGVGSQPANCQCNHMYVSTCTPCGGENQPQCP